MKLFGLSSTAAASLLCLSSAFANAETRKNYQIESKIISNTGLPGLSIPGIMTIGPSLQVLGHTTGDICGDEPTFFANTTARYHFSVKWFNGKISKEYNCEIPKGKDQQKTCEIGINHQNPKGCGNLLKVIITSSSYEETPRYKIDIGETGKKRGHVKADVKVDLDANAKISVVDSGSVFPPKQTCMHKRWDVDKSKDLHPAKLHKKFTIVDVTSGSSYC
ncbi:hypothetical protein H4219_002569 [Mycoemilia scoparia]|uniref:Uncharacterized protein n=1 Tax=Mycoemilia scoparia TaxID=417184 RepID=A0A9W7ZXY1_9FUNG|nr:hypothetical protein H4219_002569 [Mycoemilia scoparia]